MVTGRMSPSSMVLTLTPSNLIYNPSFVPRLGVCASIAFPRSKSSCTAHLETKVLASGGGVTVQFSGASTPFARGDHSGLSCMMPLISGGKVRRGVSMAVAASKKKFVYPPMTTKPRWWWRTMACVPYLLPLHEAWNYADQVYKLHPFMEKFEFLATPFLDTLYLLPNWFMFVLMYAVFTGVVRRKEPPHFLRFHIVMALLSSLAVQGAGITSGWLPGVFFRGRIAYLWMALAFAQLFTLLKCMQCSLRGMYADIAFLSEAAYTNLSL